MVARDEEAEALLPLLLLPLLPLPPLPFPPPPILLPFPPRNAPVIRGAPLTIEEADVAEPLE